MRCGVTAGTHKAEGYHAWATRLQFGSEGLITDNDPDEQQQWARYLGVLTSPLLFWPVAEMTRVIGELIEEGYPVQIEALPCLSPYVTRPIKRFGDYTLQRDLTPGLIAYDLALSRRQPSPVIQITLPFLQAVEG